MPNRRVIYRTPEFRATFTVDGDGRTSAMSFAAEDGGMVSADAFASVPFEALAKFAREYGNLTVNTGELKTAGRKPKDEGN